MTGDTTGSSAATATATFMCRSSGVRQASLSTTAQIEQFGTNWTGGPWRCWRALIVPDGRLPPWSGGSGRFAVLSFRRSSPTINNCMNIIQNIIAGRASALTPITPERAAACPHVVQQRGLTRDNLGDEEFEEACRRRQAWLAEHCKNDHVIQPVRNADGTLAGRDYRFENAREAVVFKLTF